MQALIFFSPIFFNLSFDKVHIADEIQRLMAKAPPAPSPDVANFSKHLARMIWGA